MRFKVYTAHRKGRKDRKADIDIVLSCSSSLNIIFYGAGVATPDPGEAPPMAEVNMRGEVKLSDEMKKQILESRKIPIYQMISQDEVEREFL